MAVLVQPEGDYESLIEEYVKKVSSSNDTAALSISSEDSAKGKGRRRSKTSSEPKVENQQTSK